MKKLLTLSFIFLLLSCTNPYSADNYSSTIIVLTNGNYLTAKSYEIKDHSMVVILAHNSDTLILSLEDVVEYGKPVQ